MSKFDQKESMLFMKLVFSSIYECFSALLSSKQVYLQVWEKANLKVVVCFRSTQAATTAAWRR